MCGPSSPSIPSTRKLPRPAHPIRSYLDITHKRAASTQSHAWETSSLAVTLFGREAINPRPVQYAEIHNTTAPETAGFISYSDGVHDDVNKVVWNVLAWDSDTPVREILIEYAQFFFAPEVAETAADGILALERNWIGSLRATMGVSMLRCAVEWPRETSCRPWTVTALADVPGPQAVYDVYTRHRLI